MGSSGGFGNLMALTGGQGRRFAAACALACAGTALAVAPFLLAAWLAQAPSAAAAALLAACLLLQPVLMGLSTGIAHYAAFDVLYAIRRDLMAKMARLPLGYFTRRQAGSLKRILNEDIEVLELFLSHQLPDVLACVLVPLLTLGLLAAVEWRLALAALGVVPVAYGAQVAMMRGHGGRMAEYFGRLGAINGAAVEYVRGIEAVKGMPGGSLVLAGLLGRIDEFRRFAEGWFGLWGMPWSVYAVFSGASALFVVPTGLWLAAHGAPAGDVLFGLFAATGIGAPLVKLTIYGEITMRVLQADRKIRAVREAPELPEPASVAEAPAHHGLAFEGVGLDADGRVLLDGVSFTVPAGRLTAIIGPSGAGKTTLLRLALRFGDPDRGRVTLGGVDLRRLPAGDLAARVGLVSQDVFLFDDTVAANIRLGRPGASDDAVRAAARDALCEDFIARLPAGFDTRLGEGGQRLSGGQRQRLALARTLLAGQPVLLLDEVSAFVDPWHEALIQQAVNRLAGGRTVVVVSHRLDSTRHADHLVFVQGGRVLAEGSHDRLLAACPPYARLWEVQRRNLDWQLRGQEGAA